MNLKPLGNRVLVELMQTKQDSVGGILLPDEAVERSPYGIIVAVGLQVSEPALKPRAVVMPNKHAGQPIKLNGKDCLMIPEDDIIAIVETK